MYSDLDRQEQPLTFPKMTSNKTRHCKREDPVNCHRRNEPPDFILLPFCLMQINPCVVSCQEPPECDRSYVSKSFSNEPAHHR